MGSAAPSVTGQNEISAKLFIFSLKNLHTLVLP